MGIESGNVTLFVLIMLWLKGSPEDSSEILLWRNKIILYGLVSHSCDHLKNQD